MLLYKGRYKKLFSLALILKSALPRNKKWEIFVFKALQVLSWNIRNFLSLGLKGSIPQNIRHFLRVGSFYFSSWESYFLKYKKFFRVSISYNIRKFCFLKYNKYFQGFPFLKYKKSFLLIKYKKFLNIRAKKFLFMKHEKI